MRGRLGVTGGPGLNLILDRRLYFSESDSIFSFSKAFSPSRVVVFGQTESFLTSQLQENLIFVPICRLMSLVTCT